MKRFAMILGLGVVACAVSAVAEEPAKKAPSTSTATKATYLLTGLHCPPCAGTVESSLRDVDGIRSVKVDWSTKKAKIEFDESKLPAQKISQLIADTPHMMGGNLTYGGWLALKVPEVTDKATGKRAEDSLAKVDGVKRVIAYPTQHVVGIQFANQGKLTSKQLIEALSKVGLKASNY